MTTYMELPSPYVCCHTGVSPVEGAEGWVCSAHRVRTCLVRANVLASFFSRFSEQGSFRFRWCCTACCDAAVPGRCEKHGVHFLKATLELYVPLPGDTKICVTCATNTTGGSRCPVCDGTNFLVFDEAT